MAEPDGLVALGFSQEERDRLLTICETIALEVLNHMISRFDEDKDIPNALKPLATVSTAIHATGLALASLLHHYPEQREAMFLRHVQLLREITDIAIKEMESNSKQRRH